MCDIACDDFCQMFNANLFILTEVCEHSLCIHIHLLGWKFRERLSAE